MPSPFPAELEGRDPLPLGALVRALKAAIKDVFTERELLSDINRRKPALKTASGEVLKLSDGTRITSIGQVLVSKGLPVPGGGSFTTFQPCDAFIALADAERLWNTLTGNENASMTPTNAGRGREKLVHAKTAASVVGALLQIIAAPQAPASFLKKLKLREGIYATKLSRVTIAAVLVDVMEATAAKDLGEVPSRKTVERILKDAEAVYPGMLALLYKQF